MQIYGVGASLVNVHQLQCGFNNFSLLRNVYRLDTSDGQQLVCRISCAPHYPVDLIERQSAFAMLLLANGVPTPQKLCAAEFYCIRWPQAESELHVTLETYMGSDLESADLDTFNTLGSLVGQMHVAAQKHPAHLGFSTTARDILTGRACYANILRRAHALPQTSAIRDATRLHDALVSILRPMWNKLPRGAVHGDMGIYNNLVSSHKGLAVIDFNLAGDEVFLGDLLATYYSSIHKYNWQDRLINIDRPAAKKVFLAGYVAHRKLTMLEEQNFLTIAALFDGLFYSKAAIERWNESPIPTSLTHFEKVSALFEAGFASSTH